MNKDFLRIYNSIFVNDEIFYRKYNEKIELYAYGCPDSLWDLETIASGIDISKLDKPIIIIDTCAAIDIQENISKRVVDRLTSIYPDKKIYITGCGISYDPSYYEGKGILLDNSKKFNIENYGNVKKENYNPFSVNHIQGTIKISDGCDFNCSYCTICKLRPKYMMSYEEIKQQISSVLKNGINELYIFGTEICSYNHNGLTLIDLLKNILNDFNEITRIRLDTIHPSYKDIHKLIDLIASEKRINDSLDLGIQSCSDTILKKMRRPYSFEDIKCITNHCKEAGVRVIFQVIVGFPGETESLFNESLNNITKLNPDRLILCPFSERKNTDASKFSDKVSHDVAEKRELILRNYTASINNQEEEKRDLRLLNDQKPIVFYNSFVENVDLYNKEEFISIFRKLSKTNIDDYEDLVIKTVYNESKDFRDFTTNIKLLGITFGAKVIAKITIDDDNINNNWIDLISNNMASFVEFDFKKLKKTSTETLIKFFKDVKECKMDNVEKMLERLIESDNKQYCYAVIKEFNINI